jgi:ABC-type transport system involved in multi-copper enzyme maturation permease subunit
MTAARADLRLWRAQAWAVAEQGLWRGLASSAGFGIYASALLPSLIALLHARFAGNHTFAQEAQMVSGLFQIYYLRVAVFVGCLGVFTRLFRGEMAERTLHHAFLAPLRREVLVVGKFLGAVLWTALAYGLGFAVFFFLHWAHLGEAGSEYLLRGGGLSALAAYESAILFAVLGFGAVFLLIGLLFRNAGVPALAILAWETGSGILPAWFQKLSVTHYLRAFVPLDLPADGPLALFGVATEPVSPAAAIVSLTGLAAVLLVVACWRVRRLEINYSTD